MISNLEKDVQFITTLIRFFIRTLSLPVEVITRRKFGARYLTAEYIAFSVISSTIIIGLLTMGNASVDKIMLSLFAVFLGFVFVLRFLEPKILFWWKAELHYTKIDGQSYDFLMKIPLIRNHYGIWRTFIEPSFWVIFGIAASYLWSGALGTYFALCGFMFLMKEIMFLNDQKQPWYNSIDAFLESKHAASIQDGQPPNFNQGVYNPYASFEKSARIMFEKRQQKGDKTGDLEGFLASVDQLKTTPN